MKTAEEYLYKWMNDSDIDVPTIIEEIISDAYEDIALKGFEKEKEISNWIAKYLTLEESQLQPLPENPPIWFLTYFDARWFLTYYDGKEKEMATCWAAIKAVYGTPWWAKLKPGDSYIDEDGIVVKFKSHQLLDEDDDCCKANNCRPYTGPTAAEARAKLTDEEYDALKKQWQQEMHKNDLSAELAEQAEAEAKYREGGR